MLYKTSAYAVRNRETPGWYADVPGLPSVMLSPKATNRVALIRGTDTLTVTVKLQESARAFESVTVHDTVVNPAGKLEPLDGEQTVETGGVPPATVGDGYVTTTGESAV